MELLFAEDSWYSGIYLVYTLLGVIIVFLMGLISFLSLNRKEIQQTDRERAASSEGLVKVRDIEIADKDKKIAKISEELEDLTAEHRTVVGIDIKVLMDYWAIREQELAAKAKVESENRILKIRLGDIKE